MSEVGAFRALSGTDSVTGLADSLTGLVFDDLASTARDMV